MDMQILLFGIAWVTAIVSWLLSIAELIATNRFSEWPYSKGLRVLNYETTLSLPTCIEEKVIDLKDVKAKIINEHKIFFRQKMKLFGFKISTPFPIKGVILHKEGKWIVDGRLPIFTVVFIVAWLFGWSVGGISSIVKSNFNEGISSLLMGWLVAAILVVISVPVEKRRAKLAVKEIETYVNSLA